jgi:type II restriction enzyme
MLKTQNKGEWSETYCIAKILSERKLSLCNTDLEDTGEFIGILGGYLGSKKAHTKFFINDNEIKFYLGEKEQSKDLSYFAGLNKDILDSIKQDQKNTFSITKADDFLDSINVKKIKSSSLTKSDLFLLVDDASIIDNDYSGFSIKSFLASNPTLVNASGATNFRYIIKNYSDISEYSNLKSKTLVRKLFDDKAELVFDGLDSDVFHNNLMLVDTNMPQILSEALKIYYSSKKKFLYEITDEIIQKNPLNLSNCGIYINKIKDYLFYSSVGIFPDKIWDGLSSVDGGCIIVTNDGGLKSFYIIRKNYLEYYRDFLFKNSYFDTASNTRHKFGKIYQLDEKAFLKLNLQIRIDIKQKKTIE